MKFWVWFGNRLHINREQNDSLSSRQTAKESLDSRQGRFSAILFSEIMRSPHYSGQAALSQLRVTGLTRVYTIIYVIIAIQLNNTVYSTQSDCICMPNHNLLTTTSTTHICHITHNYAIAYFHERKFAPTKLYTVTCNNYGSYFERVILRWEAMEEQLKSF